MSVYLDRFLNQPPAPLPEPAGSDRDPAAIRADLRETFDRQGAVDEAGRLVAEHVAADGDFDTLIQTIAAGLLSEDPQFHVLQNVEAAVRRYQRAATDVDRRLPLIATARYLSAHTPTRRSSEQTFDIARRLFRGEQIHDG